MAGRIWHAFQSLFADNPADVAAGHLTPGRWNADLEFEGLVETVNGQAPDANGNVDVPAGIPEAPQDGQIYVRRNGAWEVLNIS